MGGGKTVYTVRDPKKYAKELVNKYKLINYDLDDIKSHKEGALIAVKEMKRSLPFTDLRTYIGRWCESQRIFLYEVIKEIEKL